MVRNVPRDTYNYNRDQLLETIKNNPSFKVNVNQLMIIFPHLTRNFIKHAASPRAKYRMPHVRVGNKPFFIVNQVDAYLNNPEGTINSQSERSNSQSSNENAAVKNVKKLKSVK